MNVANSPAVAAALLEFYTDEHVVAMFKYAEGKPNLPWPYCPS